MKNSKSKVLLVSLTSLLLFGCDFGKTPANTTGTSSSAPVSSVPVSSSESSKAQPVYSYELVVTAPTKTVYFVGDSFNADGLAVTLFTATGGVKDNGVALTKDKYTLSVLDGATLDEAGEAIEVTVTLKAMTTVTKSFTIKVKENVITYALSITQNPKLDFYSEEAFSTTGLKLGYVKTVNGVASSEKPQELTETEMATLVSNPSNAHIFTEEEIGLEKVVELKVTLGGKEVSVSYKINVYPNVYFNDFYIYDKNFAQQTGNFSHHSYYYKDDTLDFADLTVTGNTVNHKTGETAANVAITGYKIGYDDNGAFIEITDGYSFANIGTLTVYVRYTDSHGITYQSASDQGRWNFDVKNTVVKETLTLVSAPTKVTYNVNETLDLAGLKVQYSKKINEQEPTVTDLDLASLILSTSKGEIKNGDTLSEAVADEVITVKSKEHEDVAGVTFKITILADTKKTASFYDADSTTLLKGIEFKPGEAVTYSGYVPEKASDGVAAYFFDGWASKTAADTLVDLTALTDNIELIPHFIVAKAADMGVTETYDYNTYTNVPKIQEYKKVGTKIYLPGGTLNDYSNAAKSYSFTGVEQTYFANITDWVVGTGITALDAGSHYSFGTGATDYSYSGRQNTVNTLFISKTVTKITDYAFANTGLKSIVYNGTVANWNLVTCSAKAFIDDTVTSITCTDGTVTIAK